MNFDWNYFLHNGRSDGKENTDSRYAARIRAGRVLSQERLHASSERGAAAGGAAGLQEGIRSPTGCPDAEGIGDDAPIVATSRSPCRKTVSEAQPVGSARLRTRGHGRFQFVAGRLRQQTPRQTSSQERRAEEGCRSACGGEAQQAGEGCRCSRSGQAEQVRKGNCAPGGGKAISTCGALITLIPRAVDAVDHGTPGTRRKHGRGNDLLRLPASRVHFTDVRDDRERQSAVFHLTSSRP